MRFWELAGKSCRVTVHLPAGSPARSGRPVDLPGNSQGPPLQSIVTIRVRAQLLCHGVIRTGIDSHVVIVVSLCTDRKLKV